MDSSARCVTSCVGCIRNDQCLCTSRCASFMCEYVVDFSIVGCIPDILPNNTIAILHIFDHRLRRINTGLPPIFPWRLCREVLRRIWKHSTFSLLLELVLTKLLLRDSSSYMRGPSSPCSR